MKKLIASPVDIRTGKYFGKNCHGAEKVRRLRAEYPDAVIENFYSDSHSDDPMAAAAKNAWFVNGETLSKWKNR